jgi:hypothetical protein
MKNGSYKAWESYILQHDVPFIYHFQITWEWGNSQYRTKFSSKDGFATNQENEVSINWTKFS